MQRLRFTQRVPLVVAHVAAVIMAAGTALFLQPPPTGPQYRAWTLVTLAARGDAAYTGTGLTRRRQELARLAYGPGVQARLTVLGDPALAGATWTPEPALEGDFVRLSATAATPALAQRAAADWGGAFVGWVNDQPAAVETPGLVGVITEPAALPGEPVLEPRVWTPAPVLTGFLALSLSLLAHAAPRWLRPNAPAAPAAAPEAGT